MSIWDEWSNITVKYDVKDFRIIKIY